MKRIAALIVLAALATAGLVALAMTGVVALLTDFVFGTATMVVCTAALALTFALLWYVVPLRRRAIKRDQRPS